MFVVLCVLLGGSASCTSCSFHWVDGWYGEEVGGWWVRRCDDGDDGGLSV